MKKSLAIGIMALFIGMSVIPSIGSIGIEKYVSTVDEMRYQPIIGRGDTLYVGGSGPGNYTRIQDAIDNASDGDAIFVYNGTYYENIIIDKTINLTGETKEETVMDRLYNDNIVHISSEKVSLQNFTIRNSGGFTKNAGIIIESENNMIKNCIFYRTKTGLMLNNTKNNRIDNCTFHTNGEGILFESSNYNSVISCCFGHNAIGLHFERSEGNSISFCYAHTNGIAFLLNGSSKTNIFHCNISDNSANLGGIFIVGCSELNLTNSIIRHNGAGVHIFSSEKIQIANCEFIFNTHFAVVMRTASDKVEITQCEIKNNLRYGVYIEKGNDCKITKNNIEKNTLYGVYSILSGCNARYNWWGSSFGPSYFERKPKDRITLLLGKLRCFPWLLKPLENTGSDWKENEPYMTDETNDLTEKQINLPGNDADGDNVPDWWEEKWGYDPFSWDDHKTLDPDNDGLNNIEECFTDKWNSSPFHRDIFLEIDWIESFNPSHSNKPPKNLIEKAISIFNKQNINLHIDLGNLDGGEEIPYCTPTFSFAKLRDIYWEYFLHNDINNPRKGIFHYGIICNYCPDLNFPFFGWDQLDSFAISAKWLKEENPLFDVGRLIVGAIVHHLGHSLGLLADTYGGIDNTGTQIPFTLQWWKYRNYKSCLNYHYKYKIFDYSDGTHGWGDFNDWKHLNFSFFKNSHFT